MSHPANQRDRSGFGWAGGTAVNSIFDAAMSGIAHGQMYQAWVAPDLHPGQPQPRLETWHPEDLAAYCGGQFTD